MSTFNEPFAAICGSTDVLIVCKNETQRRRAIKALGIHAMYITPWAALSGHRFKKVIILGQPSVMTGEEIKSYHDWVNETVMTRLSPHGKLHRLDNI